MNGWSKAATRDKGLYSVRHPLGLGTPGFQCFRGIVGPQPVVCRIWSRHLASLELRCQLRSAPLTEQDGGDRHQRSQKQGSHRLLQRTKDTQHLKIWISIIFHSMAHQTPPAKLLLLPRT